MIAAATSNLAALKLLMRSGHLREQLLAVDDDKHNALMLASMRGLKPVVVELMKAGFQKEQLAMMDRERLNAVGLAVRGGHVGLYERRQDPSTQ